MSGSPEQGRRGSRAAALAGACLILALAILAGCGPDGEDEASAPADSANAGAETETTTEDTETTETTQATTTTTTTTPTTTTTTDGTVTEATTETEDGSAEDVVAEEQITQDDVGLVDEGGTVFRPFAEDSPWNTTIADAPIDSRSDELLRRAATRVTAVANTADGTLDTRTRDLRDVDVYVNTTEWTVPIVTERNGVPTTLVCRQLLCGPESDRVDSLSIPPDVSPAPENDGWFSVLDRGAGVGYDFWRARREGEVISYQFIKRWDLDGPGFSAPVAEDPVRAVGARGSGLPLFAGVIQPEELEAGSINHALAISVPGPAQRLYVQPASVTNGLNVVESLPEGARIRLRSGARIGRLPQGANPRSRDVLIEALQTYGAIVVDRSRTPTLYARRNADYGADFGVEEPGIDLEEGGLGLRQELRRERRGRDRERERAPVLRGDELEGIELSDFEVVELGPELADPPGLDLFAEAEAEFDVTPEETP